MKKGRKLLACLVLIVMVLSQVPSNLLVRAEEGEEQKFKLSFELERDASALKEIYQKHDEAENESEKTDEKASDKEENGEAEVNQDVKSKAKPVIDNETVVDLSTVTEAEESSSEEIKPIDEANGEAESIEDENEEAIVLPSGGGEGSAEKKAEEVKDLNITYTLHIKGETEKTIEKIVTYSAEKADFVGDLKFEGIETLSNKLEVEYYTKDDGTAFDETLENYEIYLESNSDKTVLKLPKIGAKDDALRVKDYKFEEELEIGDEIVNEAVSGEENSTLGNPDDSYILKLSIRRPEMSDLDNVNAVYSNYWMNKPEPNPVFDREEWSIKSFDVENELHYEGVSETLTKKMSYDVEYYTWNGLVSYDKIMIPYEEVVVEYYTEDGKDWVEPYLLHYDIYLEKSDNKMILKVPKLQPKDSYPATGDEKILLVETEVKDNPLVSDIYLNGVSGNDDNDGRTVNAPVKTFNKAKEIASKNEKIKNIVVTGQTDIEEDISLEGTNAKIIRSKDYNGYLFKLNGNKSATLKNIIIDGNSKNNTNIEKSLIYVDSKATLNIDDGAVLRNNKIKAIENTATEGGAIHAYEATINMTGGFVENNEATRGGGIYLNKSTMLFSGGTIKNNVSRLVKDTSVTPTQYYSAGGGIVASEGSKIYLSGDAKVLNNSADEVGGGISLGTRQVEQQNELYMTGGIIDGNTAGSSGGGIFIQAKYGRGGASKAFISGGQITNNKMDGSGVTEKKFGGGGIYVNGAAPYYGGNGELHLRNAIIRNNTSELEGAGYAACPVSKTTIYVNDGVALYENESKDLYIYCNTKTYGAHSGNPKYMLSRRMLGGPLNNWANKDNSIAIPEDSYDKEMTIGEHKAYLYLYNKNKASEFTRQIATVEISGNTSKTRGAGIGSNGTVIFGTDNETTELKVKKEWNDDNIKDEKRPSSIKVKLMANIEGDSNKYEVETIELNAKNNWSYEFKNLPSKSNGKNIEYSVKEATEKDGKLIEEKDGKIKIDGKNYTVEYLYDKDKKTNIIKNTPDEPDKKTKEIKVSKVWDTADKKAFADKIEVVLIKNGVETEKTLILNAENNWQGSFKDLDIKDKNNEEIAYTIKEAGETNGKITFDDKEFKVSYSGDEKDGYTITNTPEEPNKEYRDIFVEKAWVIRGEKPISHIEVELYRDGEATGNTLVLSDVNGWSGSFKNLEKISDGGHIYKYSVKEIGEKFYTVEISGEYYEVIYKGDMDSGFTIINKEEPKKPQRRDVRVIKAWDITNEIPVDEIQVELYKDGRATGNVITLSEANGWMGRFEDLLAYDAEGVKYEYSVREVGEASRMISISGSDYDVSYAGDMDHSFIITNRENIPPKKKTEVRVNKTWQTSGETEAVQAELYMDGAATGKTITLSEANGWSGAFTDLDLEDAKGNKHVYTVKEVGEAGGQYTIGERVFTVSYSGDMHSGISIINTEEPPEEEEEEPSKDKDDEPKEKDKEPEKHIIPKTGVEEGSLSIVLALVVLVGLFFVKRKINEGKSK